MATICGHTREGYTCTLPVHSPNIDHAEQVVPEACPAAAYTRAFWNDGSGITGLASVVVTDPYAHRPPDSLSTVRPMDAHPGPGLTVRPHRDQFALYVGGWRVGFYSTARGLQTAIAKWRDEGAHCARRLTERTAR